MRKQRTFYVDGEKIVIVSRPRSYMKNHAGYYVTINGQRFHANALERQDAEDMTYARWVKTQWRAARRE
jgi:hypothetical protein